MTPNCQPDRPDWFPAACAVAIALLCISCTASPRRTPPAATAAGPAGGVPQPVQHYEKAMGAGPEISGIKPGWFRPVPCSVDVEQLRQQWKLEQEQAQAQEAAAARALFRWIGFPLLCLGAIALVLGGYLMVKGVDLGADLLTGGAIAAAVGAVLVLYPAYIGYASAAALAGAILWAAWHRWQRGRAERSTGEIVAGVDAARKALGETDWKNKVAPLLASQQTGRTVAWIKRIHEKVTQK